MFSDPVSSIMGDTSHCKQPESEPQQPSRILLHHPPSAAGPGLWGAQLPSSYRHGACGSPETVWQWGYELSQESHCFNFVVLLSRSYFIVCYCYVILGVGSLSRDQRRVWFADGVLPNGDTAESPKSSSPAPSQSLGISTFSNKSSTSESSEVRLAWKIFDHS